MTEHSTTDRTGTRHAEADAGRAPGRVRPDGPPDHNRQLGAHGEDLAARYLEHLGCTVLARNWRSRSGELDLVVRDGGTIAAVEVKTRSGDGYGHPLEAITARKSRRLRTLLAEWAREHAPERCALRVDAVGITMRGGERPRIDHLRGIS